MKIKPEHLTHIKNAIAPWTENAKAHRELLKQDTRVKDVEKRLRWDLVTAAKLTPWICSDLYPYLNDSHIDTALRAAVAELHI
jgi:hypothetical protein